MRVHMLEWINNGISSSWYCESIAGSFQIYQISVSVSRVWVGRNVQIQTCILILKKRRKCSLCTAVQSKHRRLKLQPYLTQAYRLITPRHHAWGTEHHLKARITILWQAHCFEGNVVAVIKGDLNCEVIHAALPMLALRGAIQIRATGAIECHPNSSPLT